MQVALIVNRKKNKSAEAVNTVCNWLNEHQVSYIFDQDSAKILDDSNPGKTHEELIEYADLIIVFGGDGTFLKTARDFANEDIPILGVNLGSLGFLTDIMLNELESSLKKLINKNYKIEERMILKGEVIRKGKVVKNTIAINDLVINKGSFSRIINLEAHINDEYLGTYPGDGLIIACPTGSTAYSLSAGGPIVNPELDALIITPICPHRLHSRSIVAKDDQEIKVKVSADHDDIMLTVDGQEFFSLTDNDIVKVNKSDLVVKLIKLEGYSFYQILRNRLNNDQFQGGGA